MSELTMIGLDIAKNMFHAVGIDADNETRLRRKLRRSQVEGFFRKQPPTWSCAGPTPLSLSKALLANL